MIGGLLSKSISRVALFAAAGMFVGGVAMPSAKAADLGGDCCADLEERVAELETTTARKGNRKMSLTITGQVHRSVLYWDDGHSSRTYYGLDNTNSSSRFTFLGSARVNPSVQMGFEIMIEIEAGGKTNAVNQLDEDGKHAVFGVAGVAHNVQNPAAAPNANFINAVGLTSANQGNLDAYFGDARRVAWWIEHKDIGRLTVGRFESAGVVATIDLGGIAMVASASTGLVNGGFFLRGPTGQYYLMNWGNLGDPAANQSRTELVRYDSPNWHGFIYTASIAEAGDYWGSMLRYAGEFSGFRIAAGVGYERIRDRATDTVTGPTQAYWVGRDPDITAIGGSIAVMHVPSGVFVQGHYMTVDYSAASPGLGSGYWGQVLTPSVGAKSQSEQFMIQGGISKNWFGIGNTAIYGEYVWNRGWGASQVAGRSYDVDPLQVGCQAVSPTFVAPSAASGGGATINTGLAGACGVTSTVLDIWGIGITQNVDAAASTLYLGYRHFSADIGCLTATCGAGGSGVNFKLPTEDIHVIVGGAVVRF